MMSDIYCKIFLDILATSFQQNYFNGATELFSNMYLAKF